MMAGAGTMLRWSCAGDDRDHARVKFSLQNLIDDFPKLRANSMGYTDYAQFPNLRVSAAHP